VLETVTLSEAEWRWMAHFTTVAGRLYKKMYDSTVPFGRLASDLGEMKAASGF